MTTPFDLGAAIIQVRATQPITIHNHLGRTLYRQFISTLQPDASIGDGDTRLPFATSGLMHPDSTTPLAGDIAVGTEAWLRVSALDAATCARLAAYCDAPTPLEVDSVRWEVTGASWADLPWASTTTYQTLMMSAHTLPEPPQHLGLAFASATTFRADGKNVPAPVPHLVFTSLAHRWADITRMPVRDAALWEGFAQHHIVLEHQSIQTETYRIKDGGKEVGFVGEARYALNPTSATLARLDPKREAEIAGDFPNLCRLAAMLIEYARYAGVGRRTGAGMGMARPL